MALFTPGERVAVGERIGVVVSEEFPRLEVAFEGETEWHPISAAVRVPSFG